MGKTLSEKLVTIGSNTARVVLKSTIGAIGVLITACIADGTGGMGGVGGNLPNPARVASTAGNIRGELKDNLENKLANEKMTVTKKGPLEFLKKMYQGKDYKETQVEKPVLSQKLWNKKKGLNTQQH